MKNLCIMEDDIPRDGGMWAQHADTLFIYVNEWDKSIASGQLWSFCVQKPIAFHGLDDLLLTLDDVLDEIVQPARWCELRTVSSEKKKTSANTNAPTERKLYHPPEELSRVHGKVGTAAIRIYARQNASMQGELQFSGKERRQAICFRSALELLHLLREWLELTDSERSVGKSE